MNAPSEMQVSAVSNVAFGARASDFLQLAKFRLSLLVLAVTAAGFCIAAGHAIAFVTLFHVVLGTAFVAFAANAGNQVMERSRDRLMARTRHRPLPAGRLSAPQAIVFTVLTAVAGAAQLYCFVNPLAAMLAVLTLTLYLACYTPLKRVTWMNTLVGAAPGAIPPMIGVAGAVGVLSVDAWLLFAILFFWQLPHFYAIAWLYRQDYAAGGYRMLSVVDPSGRAVSRQTLIFSAALIAASLAPSFLGRAGFFYMLGAAALNYGLAICAVRFAMDRSRITARALLLATVSYLPVLMALLLADRLLR